MSLRRAVLVGVVLLAGAGAVLVRVREDASTVPRAGEPDAGARLLSGRASAPAASLVSTVPRLAPRRMRESDYDYLSTAGAMKAHAAFVAAAKLSPPQEELFGEIVGTMNGELAEAGPLLDKALETRAPADAAAFRAAMFAALKKARARAALLTPDAATLVATHGWQAVHELDAENQRRVGEFARVFGRPARGGVQ